MNICFLCVNEQVTMTKLGFCKTMFTDETEKIDLLKTDLLPQSARSPTQEQAATHAL